MVQVKNLTADKLAVRNWSCCPRATKKRTRHHIRAFYARTQRKFGPLSINSRWLHLNDRYGRSNNLRAVEEVVTMTKWNMTENNNNNHHVPRLWNIQKERNQKTFEGSTRTSFEVLGLIKEIWLITRSTGNPVVPPWPFHFLGACVSIN